ncbi:beta-1,4-galactosyltransferase galt-1-like [Ylistrum balloti]|uniref:beta-1,4-galactosyltransferase galt-1-like n=1 Tax=Ylistrum balloti TaxID=509963 RepID=UPI002905A017|nr:beta-1,4-galactosyltransferase galt-1-like [Ylistrum balloti]
MISRRIGRFLFGLFIVYLTITVYITSTVLLSPLPSVEGEEYGYSESHDENVMSNTSKNILLETKHQLFRIRNPKYSHNVNDDMIQHENLVRTTNIPEENARNKLKPLEVEMDKAFSSTKNMNFQAVLKVWREKMELLQQHIEKNSTSKILHLDKIKRIMAGFPGGLNAGNTNLTLQNKDENMQKFVDRNKTVIDLRSKSVDNDAVLPKYHLNMQVMPGDTTVYSAYLDERKATKFIRIVLIGKRVDPNKNLVCKFRFRNSSNSTVISHVELYETCEGHMKYFSSFIGSCAVPDIDVLLDHVVISVDNTDLIMNVIDNSKKRTMDVQKFAICVPPLFGDVDILRLTEFIELSRILGAQHFVFYTKFVSNELSLLLNHYQSIGLATVMQWNLTIPVNFIWYHGQSASIWDCLYRTMFKFKHVAFIDFDEFIVPKMQSTVPDLLTYLQEEANVNDEIVSAYKFQSAFFDSNFNSEDQRKSAELQKLTTMNTTVRTRKLSKIRTKLVVNPVNVFELGIHHVSKPNQEHYECIEVSPKFAFIHHYRKCKSDYGMNCKLTVNDDTIFRYKSNLVYRVKHRLLNAKLHNSYSADKYDNM